MNTLAPITEKELREAVRRKLRLPGSAAQGRLYEEFGIERGAARIDIAVIGDSLDGYELKSDLDSFARMHNQIHAYNRVFDRITLIAGPTFVEMASRVLPAWWGIWQARRLSDGSLELAEIRSSSKNPCQDPYSVATLLWRDEAMAALVDECDAPPARATRSELYDRMVACMSPDSLRSCVARKLVERSVAKDEQLLAPSGGWLHHGASC